MDIQLKHIATTPPEGLKKKQIKKANEGLFDLFAEQQKMLYAQEKHSLLLVFQGMDASGKDGTVRTVFSRVNPLGVNVKPFKKPTDEEFAHDFLWRVHQAVPAKGMIQVFNRSHYEDILIQRVHNWIDEDRVKQRMKHINNFEELLMEENNTTILKFFLHVDYDEQLERLNERQSMPHKYWKHNPNDYKEREHWDAYMKAYEDCFKYCSPKVPWHIIPADKNWYKVHRVASIITETLKDLDLSYPPLKSE